MKELYDLLPNVILYLVTGFIFLKTYRFVSIVQTTTNYTHVLFESLITGFVLKSLYDLFPSINVYVDIVGMIISSFVLGYLSAILMSTKWFEKFLLFLGIRQTKNKYIWQDIVDDQPIYATVLDYQNKVQYNGKIVLIETYKEHPQIQLSEYTYSINGDLIDDFSNNPEYTVLIDTSKYSDIQISYHSDSDKVESWKLDGDPPTTIYNIFPRIWHKLKSKRKTKSNKK